MRFKTVADLPPKVIEWLGSDEVYQKIVSLNDELNAPDEDRSTIPDIVSRLALGEVSFKDIPEILQQELGIQDNKTAEETSATIYKEIFLPIKNDLQILYTPSPNTEVPTEKEEEVTSVI